MEIVAGVENINISTTPPKTKTPKRAAARKCLEMIKSDANYKWAIVLFGRADMNNDRMIKKAEFKDLYKKVHPKPNIS